MSGVSLHPAALRVLITGAAGNLGRKLHQDLRDRGSYELTLLDRTGALDSGVIGVDLSGDMAAWAHHFAGVHCVVHLAGDADPGATWPSLVANNVIATANVLAAALAGGVRKVVFASSLHTMGGHAGEATRIAPDMEARPVNRYAESKLIGESLARAFAEGYGLSAVCLRLGTVYRGDRRPNIGVDSIAWQQRWLSNADFCQACRCAIAFEQTGCFVLHITSANRGSAWDLSAAERTIGFVPKDGLTPVAPTMWRRVLARIRRA